MRWAAAAVLSATGEPTARADARAPAPIQAKISLGQPSASPQVHFPTRTVRLKGRVSGLDDPRRATLRILLRIPGYGRSDTLDTRAGPDGRFTVTLRPDVTTRVQVVVHNTLGVSGRSPTRTITVLPRQRLGLVRTSESRARFTLLLVGPTSVRLIGANSVRPRRGSARRAHLYAVAPGGRVAHRIDTAPLRSDSCGQYCESAPPARSPSPRVSAGPVASSRAPEGR